MVRRTLQLTRWYCAGRTSITRAAYLCFFFETQKQNSTRTKPTIRRAVLVFLLKNTKKQNTKTTTQDPQVRTNSKPIGALRLTAARHKQNKLFVLSNGVCTQLGSRQYETKLQIKKRLFQRANAHRVRWAYSIMHKGCSTQQPANTQTNAVV